MLKIVYRICCGMDIHKSFVVACIATTNDHGVTNLQKQAVLLLLREIYAGVQIGLSENNCKDVCMESTGKYWIPIYNILEHYLQYCPRSPEICESHSWKENRQARCQVDCRHLQARPCFR